MRIQSKFQSARYFAAMVANDEYHSFPQDKQTTKTGAFWYLKENAFYYALFYKTHFWNRTLESAGWIY